MTTLTILEKQNTTTINGSEKVKSVKKCVHLLTILRYHGSLPNVAVVIVQCKYDASIAAKWLTIDANGSRRVNECLPRVVWFSLMWTLGWHR